MKEKWVKIKKFPRYFVSNFGRIIGSRGRVLRPEISRRYHRVNLYGESLHERVSVHQLVMENFVGKRPKGLEINHIDGNKFNNHINNLEYCTHTENIRHSFKTGLNKGPYGEMCGHAKLTESKVLEIIEKYKTGKYYQKDLAKEYGVSKSSIGRITRKESWIYIKGVTP